MKTKVGMVFSLLLMTGAVSAQTGVKFSAVADSIVKSSNSSKNYGSYKILEVDSNVESYIKFNVRGLTGSVSRARLRLYVTNGSKDAPRVHTTSPAWTESGLTWKNKPARSSVEVADYGAVSDKQFIEYDVTSANIVNGEISFVLVPESSDGVDVHSRDEINPPQLLVDTGSYDPGIGEPVPGPTPVPVPAPAPSAVFTSIGSNKPTINGKTYSVQSALLDHSIRKSQNGGIYRFEVREGEARIGKDEGKERSELSAGDYRIMHGKDIWLAYSFMVEPGEKLVGTANVLGQFHASVGSPNFSFRLPYDNQLDVVLRVGTSGKYTQIIPYSKKDFVRGRWYNIVVNTKFSQVADGYLKVWIDGVQVVNRSNFVTGYTDSDSNYWKFGIYRSESIKQVQAVQFSNMELETTSLSNRITSPKPVLP